MQPDTLAQLAVLALDSDPARHCRQHLDNARGACIEALGTLAIRCAGAADAEEGSGLSAIAETLLPRMPASCSALLPLCQHRAVRCRSELLEAMRGASTDSNDRYLRATGLEGVRLLANSAPSARAGSVARARQAAVGSLLSKRWCPLTNAQSQF